MSTEVLHQYTQRDLPIKELNVCVPCKRLLLSRGTEIIWCSFCKETAYCDNNCKERNEERHLHQCLWAHESKTNPHPYKEYLAFMFMYVIIIQIIKYSPC